MERTMAKLKRMTEGEWQTCTEPRTMIGVWTPMTRRNLTDRKLTLFACACCVRIRSLFPDESCREAVELAERYVDGAADGEKVQAIREQIGAEWFDPNYNAVDAEASNIAAEAAYFCTFDAEAARDFRRAHDWQYFDNFNNYLACVADLAAESAALAAARKRAKVQKTRQRICDMERANQAELLRDLFGPLPFRSMSVPVSVLRWNVRIIPKLAQTIYDERAFERLPILADALEDAGFDNAEILAHCRSDSKHVRGCWVLDLILGKK
jgi:hypothetical protein